MTRRRDHGLIRRLIMRASTFTIRASVVGFLALGLALGTSCSSDDDDTCDPEKSKCGSGGSGGSGGTGNQPPQPIECSAATATCNPLILPFGFEPVAPCCTDEQGCGLDSAFL